jgi:hypothetical protein
MDPDFSLYSSKRRRTLSHHDLAPTIAGLLGVAVPRQNQGAFIDEIVELSSYTEDEKKLIYLDYRQQQQQLLVKLAKSIYKLILSV